MAEFNHSTTVKPKKVLEVLNKRGKPVALSALAKALGVSARAILPTLEALVGTGKVVRLDEGGNERYTVPLAATLGALETTCETVAEMPRMSKREQDALRRQFKKLSDEYRRENDLPLNIRLDADTTVKEYIWIQQRLHPDDPKYFDPEFVEGAKRMNELCEKVENGEVDPDHAGVAMALAGMGYDLSTQEGKDEAIADLKEKKRMLEEKRDALARIEAEAEEKAKAEREEQRRKKEEEKAKEAERLRSIKIVDKKKKEDKKEDRSRKEAEMKAVAKATAEEQGVDTAVKKKIDELADKSTRLTKDERMYRVDVCLDFIITHPNCTYHEIAQGHVVDERYGRLTYGMVQEAVQSIYGTSGAWLRNTKGKKGVILWSVDGIPVDISERINQRVKELRAKQIDVVADDMKDLTGKADPQQFHVASLGEAGQPVAVAEEPAELPPVEVPAPVVTEGEVPEGEEGLCTITVYDDSKDAVKPVVVTVRRRCTPEMARFAADVLAEAGNRRVEVTMDVIIKRSIKVANCLPPRLE